MDKKIDQSGSDKPAKATYATPVLVKYGKVTQITLGAGSSIFDDGSFGEATPTIVTE